MKDKQAEVKGRLHESFHIGKLFAEAVFGYRSKWENIYTCIFFYSIKLKRKMFFAVGYFSKLNV